MKSAGLQVCDPWHADQLSNQTPIVDTAVEAGLNSFAAIAAENQTWIAKAFKAAVPDDNLR
jgi:hypothetical protein